MSMNESANNKTAQKPEKARYTRDLIIAGVLLLAALALFFLMRSRQARDTGTGAQAVVTVDGQEVGRYPLRKSGTFPLNGGSNILVVENGEAWVSDGKDQPQRRVHRLPAEPSSDRRRRRGGTVARGRHDLSP